MVNSSHLTLVNQQKEVNTQKFPDDSTLAERIAYASAHPSDWFYIHSILRLYPDRHACAIARRYCAILTSSSRFDANTDLRKWIDTAKECGISISADLHTIDEIAEEKSNNALTALRWGVTKTTDQYKALANYCRSCKIEPPEPNEDEGGSRTYEGCIKRLLDKHWWRRKLTKKIQQEREKIAVKLGLVSKKKDIYCSREALADNIAQAERNERILNKLIATDGQTSISLADIAKSNISNPEIRYAELMTRLNGFEKLVNAADQETIFITVTCPSRMHSVLSKSGRINPKYDGTTPAEAHQYLQKTWEKARAKLNRNNINMEGYRIAEPHHDGCPHWHLALATDKEDSAELIDIITDYFTQSDREEKGIDNRVKVEFVKSIAGYLSKYISKNIDGKHVDKDFHGHDAKTSASNVRAWASLWNIRQFQPIGGASVTTYRELRRIRNAEDVPQKMLKIWQAADSGDWAEYENLQGGLNTSKQTHSISTEKAWSDKLNRFGEKTGYTTIGLTNKNDFLDTRPKTWTIDIQKDDIQNETLFLPEAMGFKPISIEDFDLYQTHFSNNEPSQKPSVFYPQNTTTVQLFTQGQGGLSPISLSATASKTNKKTPPDNEYIPITYEDYPENIIDNYLNYPSSPDDYYYYASLNKKSMENPRKFVA